jgi:lipid-binding SYLF domain-containing protein
MLMRQIIGSCVATVIAIGGISIAGAQDNAADATEMALKARQMEIDLRSQVVLDELLASNAGATSLFEQSAGYAVFEVTKAGGFLVTGAGGNGVVINPANGNRVYMRLASGGVGFGLGVQRYDLVIMFENQPRLEQFMGGGWDSSATAQAAAGQEGINLTSSFVDGVAFFQITDKGLIAMADVAGTRFWVADTLN